MSKKKIDVKEFFQTKKKVTLCHTVARYPQVIALFDEMLEKMAEDPLEYVVVWRDLHAKLVERFNYDLGVDAMTDAFRRRPGWAVVQKKLDELSRI